MGFAHSEERGFASKSEDDCSSIPWYVLRTHSKKETQVSRYLRQYDLETYLPLKVVGVHSGAPVQEPFFPTYLFFQLSDTSSLWPLVRWAPGAKHVVSFDSVPASVPPSLIEEIRNRLGSPRSIASDPVFKRGDRVRVVSGPFSGLDAIFDDHISGARRACILIDMLGRLVRTQVTIDHLRRGG